MLERLSLIGHDMIPITLPESVTPGMSAQFAEFLGVVKLASRVSTNSETTAASFGGFCATLTSQGIRGPLVQAHPLPTEAVAVTPEVIERARRELGLDEVPMVLVVGSHEPRKNHVAVLLAAERLWRAGARFHVVFVGGAGWKGEQFEAVVARLRAKDRPIQVIRRGDEGLLWASYRLARFTVFPSLAEGFGLPVAESLSCGTPVITSNFGSMAEIGAGGGALLVDPRSCSRWRRRWRRSWPTTDPSRTCACKRRGERGRRGTSTPRRPGATSSRSRPVPRDEQVSAAASGGRARRACRRQTVSSAVASRARRP